MSLVRHGELRWGRLSRRVLLVLGKKHPWHNCVISCKDRDFIACCLRFNLKVECAAVFVYLCTFYNIEWYLNIYICTLLIVTYLYIPFYGDSGLPLAKIFPKQRLNLIWGWDRGLGRSLITNPYDPYDHKYFLLTFRYPVSLVGISRVMPKWRP